MNTREEILAVVNDVVRKQGLDASKVRLDARLRDDIGIDSLNAVELVFAFEEAFHIAIDMSDFSLQMTVAEAIDFVAKLLPQQPAQPGNAAAAD